MINVTARTTTLTVTITSTMEAAFSYFATNWEMVDKRFPSLRFKSTLTPPSKRGFGEKKAFSNGQGLTHMHE